MKCALHATLGLVAGGMIATSALADGHVEDAAKARQGLMQVASFYLEPLGAMAKGEMPYDAEVATTSAENLAAIAALDTGAMWPEGSDIESLGKDKSRALPAAWAADSEIMEKYETWTKATADLAAVAGDGLDVMKPAIAEVGKSCGSCHDDYRAKRD